MFFWFIVQMNTMNYFYCPQTGASLVPWDSLSSVDQTFLRDKHPDAGEGAVCDMCVRSACPSQSPSQWILGCSCLQLL